LAAYFFNTLNLNVFCRFAAIFAEKIIAANLLRAKAWLAAGAGRRKAGPYRRCGRGTDVAKLSGFRQRKAAFGGGQWRKLTCKQGTP
jgi:hypothetical protein